MEQQRISGITTRSRCFPVNNVWNTYLITFDNSEFPLASGNPDRQTAFSRSSSLGNRSNKAHIPSLVGF